MVSEQDSGKPAPSGTIPDLIVVRSPESDGAQAYRSVRETLRHTRREEPIKSVLLADAGSHDHAGEAAANVGASFALNGDATVLVDVDSANPVLHQLLNVPLSPGLINWLAGNPEGGNVIAQPIATAVRNLSVLPPGGGGSDYGPVADLLTSNACERLISELGAHARYVIFHAPVAPVSSQALTIAAQVDAVLLIVRSGTTRRTEAQRAKESLERVGANLLGVVLTEHS